MKSKPNGAVNGNNTLGCLVLIINNTLGCLVLIMVKRRGIAKIANAEHASPAPTVAEFAKNV